MGIPPYRVVRIGIDRDFDSWRLENCQPDKYGNFLGAMFAGGFMQQSWAGKVQTMKSDSSRPRAGA